MEKTVSPVISVLMCVYNGEKYIAEAIESILDQTFVDFEFIIINDGSNDKTEEIILSYKDSRIKYVKNDTNLRLQASLNKGLQLCSGEFIARMDADDVCYPERLFTQLNFLRQNPSIGVLGTGFSLINGEGNFFQDIHFLSNPDLLQFTLFFFCPFAHPTIMMRAKIIKEHNGYRSEITHAEDYELWCRLMFVTQFTNLEQPLIKLRKHDTNASLDHKNHFAQTCEISRNAIMSFLDTTIPDTLLFNYTINQKCDNQKEAIAVASLFFKICHKLIQVNHMNAERKRTLKRYVVTNAFVIIRPWLLNISSIVILVRCLADDILFFLHKKVTLTGYVFSNNNVNVK
jgi:glycosyltransferase involved in cell wall biosynthesis